MLLRSTSATSGACHRPRTAQRAMYRAAPRSRVVAEARLNVEPFNGCNCFYLLEKSKFNKDSDYDQKMVRDSLDQIKAAGFSVVRTWAFQDDDSKDTVVQYMDGNNQIVYNEAMLGEVHDSEPPKGGLAWLLNEAHKRKLKLMLTLINGNPKEYGGMRKYVWWASVQRAHKEKKAAKVEELRRMTAKDVENLPNGAFFDDTDAQQLYKNYLTLIINKFKGHPAVHSWDIANEPRYTTPDKEAGESEEAYRGKIAQNTNQLTVWIGKAAESVKSLDREHPVTVGLDGFFGSSTPELDSKNPYPDSPKSDGCDFVANNRSPNLDFACIHLYPMNWNVAPRDERNPNMTEEEYKAAVDDYRAKWGVQWVENHLKAIYDFGVGKDPKTGQTIPLVLQEFNLSRWVNQPSDNPKICINIKERKQMFEDICDLLKKHTRSAEAPQGQTKFIGSMVWCMADPLMAPWDTEQYYMYQPSLDGRRLADEAKNNDSRVIPGFNDAQMQVLTDCNNKVNTPRPAIS